MSIKVMTMVWDRLDVQGGELTLALALGDFANDHGGSIWPSVNTLSRKTRQGERTVRRQLAHLRDVKWLEIVKPGGGAGQPTIYRINADWLNGAELAGFPDAKLDRYTEENGAELAGLPAGQAVDDSAPAGDNSKKPCHPRQQTLPSETKNPDTAVAANPSGTINKPLSAAPASPRGTRSAKTGDEPKPFDESLTRRSWWNIVHNEIVGLATGYGLVKYGTTSIDQLPLYAREHMRSVLLELNDYAVDALRAAWPNTAAKAKEVEQEITRRVDRDLRQHLPKSAA